MAGHAFWTTPGRVNSQRFASSLYYVCIRVRSGCSPLFLVVFVLRRRKRRILSFFHEDKLRVDVACEVNNMANGNAKPVKKIKVGAIDAAVWKNVIKQPKTDAEIVSFSVTMERRYKGQDGDWQGTNSYRINDIPKAVLALQKAYEFIAMDAGHQDAESGSDNGDSE